MNSFENLSKEKLISIIDQLAYGEVEQIEACYFSVKGCSKHCLYLNNDTCLLQNKDISKVEECARAEELIKYHAFY